MSAPASPVWEWGVSPRYVAVPGPLCRRIQRYDGAPLRTEALPPVPPWEPPPPVPAGEAVPSPLQPPTAPEIRRWREVRGWSQDDLAYRVGVGRSVVAEMERGSRPAVELRQSIGRLMAKAYTLPRGEVPGPLEGPPPGPVRATPAPLPGRLPPPPSAEACVAWRTAQGLSQRALARLVGGHSGYVAVMERGERPHVELRHRIAALMAERAQEQAATGAQP